MHVLSESTTGAAADGRRPLLEVTDVAKRYGSIQALGGVSVSVATGEVHGLCGHNGAGKSTLVKILTGLVRPDAGRLLLDGHELELHGPRDAQAAGIALVDQELSIVPALTVAENLFLGDIHTPLRTDRGARREAARGLLARLGLGAISPDRPASELTVGERQLVEIARALHREARLLILDEPTATLSKAEIERVFAAIREVAAHGCAVIFISHRLDEVLSLCDRVTVMRDGAVVGIHAVGELDRPRLIELLLGEAGVGEERPARRRKAGDVVVRIRGLAVEPVVERFDLDLHAGQIVGLAGQIGSGSEDVLRALGGVEPSARGVVAVHGRDAVLGSPRTVARAGVAYVSGDRKGAGLFLGRSIAENLLATRLGTLGRRGALPRRTLLRAARELARVVGVDERRVAHPVGDLSGGNQQKVFIGRCLQREGCDVLLLDEPTRGVDVGGRAEIHELIRDFASGGRGVLFASTELDELLDLADVIVTMFEGRVVAQRPRAACTPPVLLAEMTTGRVADERREAVGA